MKPIKLLAALAAATLCAAGHPARAQHAYAGIIDTNGTPGLGAGDALAFVDKVTGALASGSGLGVLDMTPATIGAQAGLFFTGDPTLTALSNGRNWTGAAYRAANPFAALAGSQVQVQVVSATGPTGATLGIWDENVSLSSPIFSYTIGTSGATGYWNLTDLSLIVGDGVTTVPAPTGLNNPPVDPYGHIHGRSFTVDTAGEYTVGFLLHDLSGTHADGAPFVVSFSAVPEPAGLALLSLGVAIIALVCMRRRAVPKI